MHVSVVVPVHNEASTLPDAVPALVAELSRVGAPFDVALVENGSTDATAAVAAELASAYPEVELLSLGDADYGAAMRLGFLQAPGDWVVNFDIDYFSGEFVTSALASDADLVVASKRIAGANDTREPMRRLATWVFNLLLRILFRAKVSDTHGMKAVRRSVVDAIGRQVISTQDMFDTELVIRAERAGFSVAEIPATVVETREARSGLWSRVPRTLVALGRLRLAMWRKS